MPFSHGQNDGDLLGKLESLLAPLDKLRIALNVSNQAIIVFDGEQFCYLNRVAEDLLSLKESNLVGCPVREVPLSGEMRGALTRALESSRAGKTPFREQVSLGPDLYLLEAKEAAGAITLVTFEAKATAPKVLSSKPGAGRDQLPVSTFLHLATLVARELPPDSEGARVCRQILETVSQGDSTLPALGESANYRDDLFTVTRDVASLLRYSLGSEFTVECTVPDGVSSSDFPGESLRRLVLTTCMSSSREISAGGSLHLSAREGEDSAVFEVRVSAMGGGLGTLDEKGLKSCREQCEALGGHLVVWSESGKRVRLINLPFSDDRPAQVDNTPDPLSQADGKGKTVLLVDDEDAIRAVGRAALSRIGYTVYLAKDGVEGVEIYREKKDEIDLVLLDLVMPRLGGAGCFEQLKEINPDVKVVLMSGFTRNHRVNDLMESGCLHFLRKPFELTDLLTITREVTSGARPGRES